MPRVCWESNKHDMLANVDLMVGQRRRRWPNNESTLSQHLVFFTEFIGLIAYMYEYVYRQPDSVLYCSAKLKDSICLPHKWADTAFWHCRAVYIISSIANGRVKVHMQTLKTAQPENTRITSCYFNVGPAWLTIDRHQKNIGCIASVHWLWFWASRSQYNHIILHSEIRHEKSAVDFAIITVIFHYVDK